MLASGGALLKDMLQTSAVVPPASSGRGGGKEREGRRGGERGEVVGGCRSAAEGDRGPRCLISDLELGRTAERRAELSTTTRGRCSLAQEVYYATTVESEGRGLRSAAPESEDRGD